MSFQGKYEQFEIAQRSAFFVNSKGDKQRATGQSMVVVTDKDGHEFKVNGQVSDSYQIHQPFEVLAEFEKIAEQSNLEVTKVMTNPANAGMIIQARYGNVQFADEDNDVNVVFFTDHSGKYKTFLTLQAVRIACMNQVPMLYKGKDRFIFAEKHCHNSLSVETIAPLLEEIPASVIAYNQVMEQLAEKEFSYGDFIEFMKERAKIDDTSSHYANKIVKWQEAYYHADNSNIQEGTAYKALHAISYINTHNIKNTQFSNENRLITKSVDTQKVINYLMAA